MIITIIILSWLFFGSLTFGIACVTNNTVQSWYKLIFCTMLGLIGLIMLIIHVIDEQDQSLRGRLKRANKFMEKTMKSILFVACAIGFASCGPNPRVHADIVKDRIGLDYYVVNDSVVHNVTNGKYYAYKSRTHQYIIIE